MLGYDRGVHRPPPFFLYYGAWLILGIGVWCLVLGPIHREWHLLVFGFAGVGLGIPGMAFLAWMRDRYNEWHPEDRGLIDDLGFPVSRTELMSDAFATWAINLVWRSFRSDR